MDFINSIFRWLLKPVRFIIAFIMKWADKERMEALEERIQELEESVKFLMEDPGYEIITYWDDDGTTWTRELGEALKPHIYRYPRTIFSKKTGTIQEIPFPGDKKNK